MPVSIKSRLGRYEILSQIGAGGMGEVYRAQDTTLGRDVAIKVLPEAFVRDRERMERFQREAKFLAALNHPNIAAIYGIEDAGSTDALVMELAEGPTLADRIASGPIPLAEVLPIARQIADALEYAHEHGVVHRDLKPANIKVSRDDCVKVLDFGLARAVEGEASATDVGNSPTISHMATQAGVLLGTAAYMSPEQVKAKPVDRRADIWAFGCVLYEMLTAKKAFPGDTVAETLVAILHNEPDWSQLPSETPIRVRVLLQRCLRKDPKQRLRDIGDARISLDETFSGSAENLPALAAAPPLWRRALPWALLGVTALATTVLAVLHFRERPSAPADPVRFQVALPEKSSFVTEVSVSPDGRHLAFTTVEQDGSTQLYVRDLDSLVSRPLPTLGGNVASPFWSPDSRTVAFQSGVKLARVDISGGTPQMICSVSFLNNVSSLLGGAWNPDGVILFGSQKGLMKVSAAGGEPSVLIKVRPGVPYLGYPSFLPDGRHFLYNVFSSPTYAYVGSLDPGDEQQSSKPLTIDATAVFVPSSIDGTGSVLLFKRDHSLVVQALDMSSMELKGDPRPVAVNVNHYNVSTNGVLAYSGGNSTPQQLTWFDRKGKTLGTVGKPGITALPAISPDGKTVAVPVFDGSSGRTDIWLYDLRTGTPNRFTFDGSSNLFPVWSPDGSRIAFFSNRKGHPGVYEKPINGVEQVEILDKTPPSLFSVPQSWSPDGRYLIEAVRSDTSSQIWVLPLSPGHTSSESESAPWLNEDYIVGSPRLSPDGKWMAYRSFKTGSGEIFVRTFPNSGGEWQVSANGGMRPVWSRDGKELYYFASDGNLMSIDVKSRPDGSLDHGAPNILFNPHSGPTPIDMFDVTRDGRFLIPSLIQQPGAPITVFVNWRARAE